jgi:hypothetical protein
VAILTPRLLLEITGALGASGSPGKGPRVTIFLYGTLAEDYCSNALVGAAALDHLESTETVFANQWINTAKEQARRLEDEALHLVENAPQLNIESMTLQVASFSIGDTPQQIDREWRVSTPSAWKRIQDQNETSRERLSA